MDENKEVGLQFVDLLRPATSLVRALESAQKRIDEAFADLSDTVLAPLARFQHKNRVTDVGELPSHIAAMSRPDVSIWIPNIDVEEQSDHYNVLVEVPGVKPEDIKVELLDNHHLQISGRKEVKRVEDVVSGKKHGTFHLEERTFGSFRRVLAFEDELSVPLLQQSHTHGVLSLNVPKKNPHLIQREETKEEKVFPRSM